MPQRKDRARQQHRLHVRLAQLRERLNVYGFKMIGRRRTKLCCQRSSRARPELLGMHPQLQPVTAKLLQEPSASPPT